MLSVWGKAERDLERYKAELQNINFKLNDSSLDNKEGLELAKEKMFLEDVIDSLEWEIANHDNKY